MRWLDVMMDRPRLVIAAVTLICALSAVAVALTRDGGELIRVDADLSALTSSDRPASALHDRYAARFGESGLLLATARHEDLLSAPGLRAVTQAHDALAALPGAGRVRSLASQERRARRLGASRGAFKRPMLVASPARSTLTLRARRALRLR